MHKIVRLIEILGRVQLDCATNSTTEKHMCVCFRTGLATQRICFAKVCTIYIGTPMVGLFVSFSPADLIDEFKATRKLVVSKEEQGGAFPVVMKLVRCCRVLESPMVKWMSS